MLLITLGSGFIESSNQRIIGSSFLKGKKKKQKTLLYSSYFQNSKALWKVLYRKEPNGCWIKQNCEKWWNPVTQLDHLNTTWIWFKKQSREVHSSVSSCRHKSVPNWSQKCLPNATQMQSLRPLGRANKLAKFCYLYVFKNERK
jgi:hypothetical protein